MKRIFFLVIILALLSGTVIAQQGNKAWLPFVAGGDGAVRDASLGIGITPAERPGHIPADWVQHPDGPDGAASWGPDTSNAPPSFEGVQSAPEPGGIIYAAGKETKGREVFVGKLVKMPNDMYVEHYITEQTCSIGEVEIDGKTYTLPPCLPSPLQILAREGTSDTIILLQDGQLVVQTENPETFARVVATFSEVTSQATKPPIMDPRLQQLPPGGKAHALP